MKRGYHSLQSCFTSQWYQQCLTPTIWRRWPLTHWFAICCAGLWPHVLLQSIVSFGCCRSQVLVGGPSSQRKLLLRGVPPLIPTVAACFRASPARPNLVKSWSQQLAAIGDSVAFWPVFGSRTDTASFRQSGWHFEGSPTTDIWNVPGWLDRFLSLRALRCGNLPLDHLSLSTVGKVRPASRAIIAGWVKTTFKGAGISYSVGSSRSAVNSSLARDNFCLDVILARGNWILPDTFLRHYYRPLDRCQSLSANNCFLLMV